MGEVGGGQRGLAQAGLLTPTFVFGIYHPEHTYTFDSCAQNGLETGNSILANFTEAAGEAKKDGPCARINENPPCRVVCRVKTGAWIVGAWP